MRFQLFLTLFLCSTRLFAQSNDETAIRNLIDQVFTGMHKSDSAMVRSAFTREITMATVARNKKNEPLLHRENSLADFLKAIASPKMDPWTEEYWDLKILIDGDFASAWCDYAFYVGKTFSHCGVDAFHLHKTSEGWKIFHLADTRKRDGCVIPKEIESKYK